MQCGKPQVSIGIGRELLAQLGWALRQRIDAQLGTGAHHGFLWMVRNDKTGRLLNGTEKHLRLKVPVWPGCVRTSQPAQAIGATIERGGLLLTLPQWAVPDAAAMPKPVGPYQGICATTDLGRPGRRTLPISGLALAILAACALPAAAHMPAQPFAYAAQNWQAEAPPATKQPAEPAGPKRCIQAPKR
jgi:hypothetical protein